MLKKTLGLVAFIVTLFAVLSASSACFFFLYQPKVPKVLLK
ncbi:MAG TPA: cyclic lactone autoinducer peptide [Hungateiclostridium thermocellum]|jgi:cyclic lactone autoinducer peptide|nr:cyclic lactone autoinducer peptide [Acetivibrio thermocellus]ADU73124.1 putative lipoprotein [Acetivibrio thermocellus DSM 1313]NLU26213.1 cyclic lactone autoinducer peptide [Acetivibrio thermocellus]THJ79586.1 cyclic lactone autoinducer peptide [Acetivibrio thermocellus]UWV46960.1 cyclic lactone autoinducer peptide [Acetivibrio thermocellus]SOD21798.1 cyclic lactone autoinducer peptide [Acetivibrio thermocellus]